MIKLHWSVINSGKSGQTTLTLREADQAEWLLGRGEGCDLVLPDPHVTSTHAKIVFSNGEFYLIDLNSRNGTSLNGEKISPAQAYPLRINDVIHLGVVTGITIDELQPLLQSSPQLENVHTIWTTEPLNIHCCRIVEETPDTKSFVFAGEHGERFDFLPGQFAALELNIDGQKVIRPYSISSAPLSHLIEFTIKRVPSTSPDAPPGVVSNWINDQLQIGDMITLKGGPKGSFTCGTEIPPRLLLISAGSGITPMMSMMRWIFNTPWSMQTDVVFFHVARTPRDIAFREELEWMSARMPNLQLLFTMTRPQSGFAWSGLTGRLSSEMLHLMVPDLQTRSVFVCGSNAMMQHTKEIFSALSFPMENYHEESFGDLDASSSSAETSCDRSTPTEVASSETIEPSELQKTSTPTPATQLSSEAVSSASNTATTVKFTQAKKTTPVEGDLKLLEVAEQVGVPIDSSCWSGRCGTCKVKVCGKVEYRKEQPSTAALNEQEQTSGYVLACIAYPVGSVEVEA